MKIIFNLLFLFFFTGNGAAMDSSEKVPIDVCIKKLETVEKEVYITIEIKNLSSNSVFIDKFNLPEEGKLWKPLFTIQSKSVKDLYLPYIGDYVNRGRKLTENDFMELFPGFKKSFRIKLSKYYKLKKASGEFLVVFDTENQALNKTEQYDRLLSNAVLLELQ